MKPASQQDLPEPLAPLGQAPPLRPSPNTVAEWLLTLKKHLCEKLTLLGHQLVVMNHLGNQTFLWLDPHLKDLVPELM